MQLQDIAFYLDSKCANNDNKERNWHNSEDLSTVLLHPVYKRVLNRVNALFYLWTKKRAMQMDVGTCYLSNQSTQAKVVCPIMAITIPSYYYFLVIVIVPLKLILVFALFSGAQGYSSKAGDASPP